MYILIIVIKLLGLKLDLEHHLKYGLIAQMVRAHA